jgi:hypothetical protein
MSMLLEPITATGRPPRSAWRAGSPAAYIMMRTPASSSGVVGLLSVVDHELVGDLADEEFHGDRLAQQW